MKELTILSEKEKGNLNPFLLNIIAYRKSGLSLNHIIGCTLDCAYCVRHFFDNFEMKSPRMLCNNDEAIDQLINHPFFVPDITPIQLFNRATDPFLPKVKKHTHEILKKLDDLGLKNNILIITRAKVTQEGIEKLEELKHLQISLLLTYSGIDDIRIEPIAKSRITVDSIKTISKFKNRTKLIMYWRPIVSGWNDDSESFDRVLELADFTDAIVYTGYYHRPENLEYLNSVGVSVPYSDDFARRKLLPKNLEKKIFKAYTESGVKVPLFRKTSCGVAYAHKIPDYNGHWGVKELCDICPESQREICRKDYQGPTDQNFQKLLNEFEYDSHFLSEDGHIWTTGLGEERRYHLQHILRYQIWDIEKPHYKNQHGRSPFGQLKSMEDENWYQETKNKFYKEIIEDDD